MKRIFVVLFTLSSLFALAQEGAVTKWDSPRHNFGEVKEEGGSVSHKFNFTNTGDKPLVITNVHASCGCTSTNYTRTPVKPGGKGFVEASYNPKYRPGNFTKTITVTTNSTKQAKTILYIMGNVLPRPKTKEDLYPRKIGQLNFKTNHLAFGKTTVNDVKTDSVPIANLSEEELTIKFTNVPNNLKVKAVPAKLKPQQTGYIEVTYNAKQRKDWGFVIDRVRFALNDDENNKRNYFSVSASIYDDFSKMTEKQKEKAPRMVFESKTFNFGNITEGQQIHHNYKFKNEGKTDLIIRKVKSSCGCTATNLSSNVIKAGATGEFKVTFNSRGKRNRQNQTVTIITNDPNNTQVTLRLSGNVSPKKYKDAR